MRLDKFMKVSRLAKRRSEAHEALEHGRITKGGKPLKPGYQVKPGDVLEIHYATKFVTVRVREVPLRVTPSDQSRRSLRDTRDAQGRCGMAMTSADTKDALARDVPAASHCREALLAGLALYGSATRRVRHASQRRRAAFLVAARRAQIAIRSKHERRRGCSVCRPLQSSFPSGCGATPPSPCTSAIA